MYGHLVIADISGYTQFLTTSELEHANGILGELLNAIINSIQAPLAVSSIEGDAVFMWGQRPADMSGQTVLESVELLYHSFQTSLETMVLNTTCQCNACVNIKALGLKIVMHCGEFMMTDVGGRQMLSGPAVITAHRLLKNTIRESTGIDDYLLVTEECVEDLNIQDIVASWARHSEEYEHIGSVGGYVSSLPEVYEFMRSQNEDKVLERDAWVSLKLTSKAPLAVVWDHLIDPMKRTKWLGVAGNNMVGLDDGRIVPGTEYHCVHGDHDRISVFTVLDVRPMEYVTFLFSPVPGFALRWTDYLIPSGAGTRLVTHLAAPIAIESGETAPPEVLEMFRTQGVERHKSGTATMIEMADKAAEQLEPV